MGFCVSGEIHVCLYFLMCVFVCVLLHRRGELASLERQWDTGLKERKKGRQKERMHHHWICVKIATQQMQWLECNLSGYITMCLRVQIHVHAFAPISMPRPDFQPNLKPLQDSMSIIYFLFCLQIFFFFYCLNCQIILQTDLDSSTKKTQFYSFIQLRQYPVSQKLFFPYLLTH